MGLRRLYFSARSEPVMVVMTRMAVPIQSRLTGFRPTAESGRRFVAVSRVLIVTSLLGGVGDRIVPAFLLASKSILLQSKKSVERQFTYCDPRRCAAGRTRP